MNISAAAEASGLPVKTVRYYADIGLVDAAARTTAGYRTYDDSAVRKLVFIRRAREFGFTIEECKELLPQLYGHDLVTLVEKYYFRCIAIRLFPVHPILRCTSNKSNTIIG